MFRRYSADLVRIGVVTAAIVVLMPAGPRARQASLPSAQAVIDRFVQASGGAAAQKAVKSLSGRGVLAVSAQNLSGELEIMASRPNRQITRVTIPGIGRIEEAFDGKVGWSIDPINGPEYVREMTVIGREEFDARPAYRLKVVLASGTEQVEFFDVETGMQIGLEATRESPLGPVPTTIVYREYKAYGALTYPSKVIQRVLGIEQVVTFTTLEFDTVPVTAFDMPPVIKALIK
jgi:hypothetical protein